MKTLKLGTKTRVIPVDPKNVSYEWDIETVTADEHEEILEHDHRGCLCEYGGYQLFLAKNQVVNVNTKTFTRLVLVRDVGNEVEGITDRAWAYLNDEGTLPEFFDNGRRVPARYIKELNR